MSEGHDPYQAVLIKVSDLEKLSQAGFRVQFSHSHSPEELLLMIESFSVLVRDSGGCANVAAPFAPFSREG